MIHRGPVRVIHREPVRVNRDIVRAPMTRELVRFFDPFRDLLWRRRQRAILPAPVRPRLPPPLARFVSGNARRAPAWWPFLRSRRPRPLYHMSFARPMSQRELHRLLMFVPQLRAHPEGVLAEMAGLVGQARDVRGVDATTGEYLLLPGETLIDVAFKLVGDRGRWRELLAANPLRAEGDPRVRIPPSWFGYVPYSIPLRRVRELLARRRRFETAGPEEVAFEDAAGIDDAAFYDAGDDDEAGDDEAAFFDAGDTDEAGDDAGDYDAGGFDEAGAVRGRRVRRVVRRRARRARWVRPGGMMVSPPAVMDPSMDEEGDELEEDDAGDPDFDAFRRYIVMRSDLRAPGTPDHTRAVAEAIAIRHGLWDGERWSRPRWWAELRDINPHKPLNSRGWWRDIGQGEELWIPGPWPIVRLRVRSDGSEVSGPIAGDAPHRYLVARTDVRAPGTPDVVRATAEAIAIRHGLWDGERWMRPRWWVELRGANPHKSLGPDGWWRDIAQGEVLWIPASWPVVKQRSADGSDTGDLWDDLAQLGFSGASSRSGRDASEQPEEIDPRFSRNPANRGRRPQVTAQVYTVVRGDWPQRIARKFSAERRRHWLTELQKVNPQKPVDSGMGNWFTLTPGEVINIPDAWTASDTGWLDDAGAPRQNLTTRTYAVVAGDGMQRIAQKLGAAARSRWFGELRDANPHKAMKRDANGKQLGWVSLVPGEIINIPDAWSDTPQLRPAPGGAPTPAPHQGLSQFPTFPGGAVPSPTAPPGTVPAAATVDPGTILRAQAILVAFRKLHPEAIVPKDFGTGSTYSPDVTGVLTARTQQALASFQRWSNGTTRARLRTDGVLDPDTIAALDSFSAQAIAGLSQRPLATPAVGATPSPGDGSDGTDPFAGFFKAASEVLRAEPDDMPVPRAPVPREPAPRVPAPAAPRRPMPMAPPEPMALDPVLNDLPDALQQYGIPGVPGLPGGAPHAPKPQRPRVEPPVAPPPPAAPGPAAQKQTEDAVVPMVLTGLGILSGIFG